MFEINKIMLIKCSKQTILLSKKGKDPFTVRYDRIREIVENDETKKNYILPAGEALQHQHKYPAAPAEKSEYQYIYTE